MITQQVFILNSSHCVPISARRGLACWFGLLFSVGLNYGATQGGGDVRWLEEGKPIERNLSGGESHFYHLKVTAGEYARVIVEQKGIDVVVNVLGPDGKLITAVNHPNGSQSDQAFASDLFAKSVRGFMYAGAPRVMASMWEVDDVSHCGVDEPFLQRCLAGEVDSGGSAAAQIEMLRKSHWQSPYYWGAFVLQGEWR